MARIKLTRPQMALASGESLEDFDKRTDGKDPTAGVELGGSSQFFEPADDSDVLVDDEIDQSQYLPDDDDSDGVGDADLAAEKKPAKARVPGWADDDARKFAASYGLKDADLSNFETVDDLYEYGRATDSSIAKDAKADAGDKANTDKANTEPGLLDRLKLLDRQKYIDAQYGDEELQIVDGLNATIEAMREVFPSVRILAQREAALAFPVSAINESDAAGYRASAEAVAKQSRRRRPTSSVGKRGVSSGTVGKSTPKDDARSILSNPAVQQFWKRTQRENGAD